MAPQARLSSGAGAATGAEDLAAHLGEAAVPPGEEAAFRAAAAALAAAALRGDGNDRPMT